MATIQVKDLTRNLQHTNSVSLIYIPDWFHFQSTPQNLYTKDTCKDLCFTRQMKIHISYARIPKELGLKVFLNVASWCLTRITSTSTCLPHWLYAIARLICWIVFVSDSAEK